MEASETGGMTFSNTRTMFASMPVWRTYILKAVCRSLNYSIRYSSNWLTLFLFTSPFASQGMLLNLSQSTGDPTSGLSGQIAYV